MDLGLEEKVVFVSGASGGIGRAVADAFGQAGARVALHGHRNANEMAKWVSRQTWRSQAIALRGDIRDPEEVSGMLLRVVEALGRVDVCVANAGIWPPEDRRLDEMDPDRAVETIRTNLLGSMWTARAFLQALAQTGPRTDGHGASLVFVGSTAGRFGERGHADYAASKAGLRGLVASLKNEIVQIDPYGRVNMVEPGWTVTHMARPALDQPGTIKKVTRTMALRQLGRAEDVARAVLTLSSPVLSRHVTGEVLMVAGGMEGRVVWEPSEIQEEEVRRRLTEE